MPDGTGFSLLNMFDNINFEVVFISGFDSYALQAFEFNALDYILKPIDPNKLSKTLKKIQTQMEKTGLRIEELKIALQSYDIRNLKIAKIPVHRGKNVVLVDIADLLYVKADEGCTIFKSMSNDKIKSSKQLSDFEFILAHHAFMIKVNKNIYVNISGISSYSKGINCFLTLKDGSCIEISRRKKGEVRDLLSRNMIA